MVPLDSDWIAAATVLKCTRIAVLAKVNRYM